jgi:beta-lactamase regulating signal transducer with metallopeptidase domain/HEAT repeat protein
MGALTLGHFGTVGTGNTSLLLLIVKATIILMGALTITLVMQRAAAGTRHLVWLVTLGVLLLVPALSVWAPLRLKILAPPSSVAVLPSTIAPAATTSPRTATVTPSATANTQAVATTSTLTTQHEVGALARIRAVDPLLLLFAAWLIVAFGIAATLAYAALSLRGVVRASRPLNDQEWLNMVWEISDRLGLESAPRLLQSVETKMPFACGVFHPTIVLPAESESWSLERRRAVLLHELAHVRRRDLVGHTLGRIACAVYWFHPLIWTAAKRLRSESERACDDMALNCGTRPADYAEHLLDIVTSVRRERTPLVALAMARRKEFEGRMLAILDPQLKRAAPSRGKSGAMVASLAVLAVVVGAASPVQRNAPAVTASRTNHVTAANVVTTAPQLPAPAHEKPTEPVLHVAKNALADVVSRITTIVTAPIVNDSHVRIEQSDVRVGGNVNATSPSLDRLSQAQTPDERAELLAKILKTDTSASIRRTAAWGLRQYADDVLDASSALVTSLQHDSDADVREMSAWALCGAKDGDASVISALSSALRSDASESVRKTSAWSLAQVGNSSAASAFASAMSDRSAAVRANAAWAFGNIDVKSAPAALVAGLKDSDSKVRAATAWALHNISDESTIPALQDALRGETDSSLQIDYIRALAAMGGDASVDALRTLLVSPDVRVKSIAVKALAGGGATGPWPWPMPMPRPNP